MEGHPGGGLSRPHRGAAAGLSRAPARAGGELPGLHAPARARRAAFPCLALKERRSPSRRGGDLGFSGEGSGGMTMHAAPPTLLIPESAPFSPDQRAWLSGYFAALLSPDLSGATPLSPADAAGLAGDAPAGPILADAGDAPWHDPAFALNERLKMAESRPLAPRLMAAMAQQDCGQCGYNCADYANALFLKKEERLNLCAPRCQRRSPPRRRSCPTPRRSPAQPLPGTPAKIRRKAPSCRAAGSMRRTPRKRPGTSKSTLPRVGSAMRSATASACLRPIIRSSSIR